MSKLDELKEKFQDMISDLRSKLPGGNKSDDEYEDDDEFDEDTGEFDVDAEESEAIASDKTDVDIEGESESEDADDEDEDDDLDDDEEEELDEEQAKAEKKKKLMRVGLIVIVIALAADSFLNTDDSAEDEAQKILNAAPKPKPKRKVRKKKKVAKENVEQANKNKEVVVAKVEDKKTAVEKAPTEKIVVPQEAKQEVKKEPVKEPVVEPVEVKVAVKEPTPEVEEIKVAEVKAPEMKDEPSTDQPDEKKEPVVDIPPETNAVPLGMEERVGESSVKEEKSGSLDEQMKEIAKKTEEQKEISDQEQKKIDDLKYVEPPNYTRYGRGLVYNCIEKHWACVDKFAYLQCRENLRWSKQNSKDPECVIKNVYMSDDDCSKVQAYYINTNEATDFCERGQTSETEVNDLEQGATELIIN
tara:strand:+ start:40318 stop:41562 length:1245 start_codon:yes stop_codon:yes gene_type:complete